MVKFVAGGGGVNCKAKKSLQDRRRLRTQGRKSLRIHRMLLAPLIKLTTALGLDALFRALAVCRSRFTEPWVMGVEKTWPPIQDS